ncbi:hypothetical protein CDAR_243641 [Caerostris darwini]|uniref:Uncharacterized protein n=1 Tax=Caerostris darwini TaxID=1538125 RepID=A0AAV4VCW2_9ARAC|nr:hypothetical protein CDAR_243641 [Caerostris darwini]
MAKQRISKHSPAIGIQNEPATHVDERQSLAANKRQTERSFRVQSGPRSVRMMWRNASLPQSAFIAQLLATDGFHKVLFWR